MEEVIEEHEKVTPVLENEHLWKLIDIALERYPKAMEGLETLEEQEERILTDSILLQKCNSIYVVYLLRQSTGSGFESLLARHLKEIFDNYGVFLFGSNDGIWLR